MIALFLKSPSDEYIKAFEDVGYTPHFVPVIDTFLIIDKLAPLVTSGPLDTYSGVIITSARAVDAWGTVMASQKNSSWSLLPFYVVGHATANALRQIFPEYNILGAEESGTSENLAHYIVSSSQSIHTLLPLLYLTGDKTRPVLPGILSEAGISTEEVQVYETRPSPTISDLIHTFFNSITPGDLKWIVFFAPSSSKVAIPFLQAHIRLPTANDIGEVRVAAIGPTTATWLQQQGLVVDVVASKPDANVLAQSIRHHDQNVQDFPNVQTI